MATNDTSFNSFLSLSSISEGTDSNGSISSIPSLNENLNSYFSDVPKNFNIVHINAQSIPAHYPDLLSSFDSKDIHAILISESWLKPCLQSTSYSLPGFHLIRNDRIGRVGGGVAIYLRAHIPFSIVSTSLPLNNAYAEHLLIEVILNHTKLLLGVFYSPNLTVDYFSSFEILVDQFMPSYEHTLIMGDFNTCLLKNDSRASRLQTLVNSANLNILPLAPTHHFPHSNPSLLDLILVSSIDHVARHGQCPALAFSYHDLLYVSYKVRPPKAKSRILLQRNFGGMDLERLTEDARKIDWTVIDNARTVDEQINLFNGFLISLYDTRAPVRPVRMKHLPAPWLTADIKKLQEKKHNAKSKYISDGSDANRNKYVRARNRCNRVCRDSQRRHIYKSVIEEDDPAKVWKFLKSLGVGKTKHKVNPSNLDLNSLNQHFTSSSTIDSTSKLKTLIDLSSLPTPQVPPFKFSQFTVCDVKRNIIAIKSDAVGADCISRKMIIPIIDILAPVITSILNRSIQRGDFPSIWKDAQILPLPKKINPSSFSDYRPISILPLLSKVLERLVHKQLSTFLLKHNFLSSLQSGFRHGHSTTTALVKITDDIRHGMDDQKITVLTLLDFSNAFSTVDFDILLALLTSLNISPEVIDWFRSYLCGRRQRIRIDDSYSEWSFTSAGVPQGGVLPPLLFSIFINTICLKISSLYHLYADDLQIYAQGTLTELPNTIQKINDDLKQISVWSKHFGLTINPLKSQAIVIGSPRLLSKINLSHISTILIDGTSIPFRESVRNLGVIMDKHLSWEPQIVEVSKKIYAASASLRRLRNFLPIPTKIALANSLLLPILDYADICYLDIKEEQLNKLERLQNLCIRFIFGIRKYDHVSEFRDKLKWLPIRLRRNTHILHLLYSVLFNPSTPPYLKKQFRFLHDVHSLSLRSQKNLLLEISPHSSSFLTNSYTIKAARLWNSLPISIRHAISLQKFNTLLKNHFMNI